MTERAKKRPIESRTEQIQILMPQHINGYNRLFGGRLMEWIDIVAGVVARRHSGHEVTTALIDTLDFKKPAHLNQTILLVGQVTCVGNTSMEVRVDTFVESLGGEKELINRAYLVMVALDENEQPVTVPELIVETADERAELAAGKRRSALRKQRRQEKF